MADIREVFTILEDNTTGAGVKLPARAEGDSAGGNHAPVVTAKDLAGNYQLAPHRSPGEADSDGIPGFSFKDSSGNLIRPSLNSSGAIVVSSDPGTSASASGEVTVAALNTEETLVSIAVAVDDVIQASMAMGGSFQPCLYVLYKNDNGARTEQARFITGPGDFQHSERLADIQFTMGAAGTQSVELRVTQLRGPLSDAYGTISIRNLG